MWDGRLSYEVALGSQMSSAFEAMFDRSPQIVDEILAHVGRVDCTKLNAKIKSKSEERAKNLRQVLNNNCFRQCGICPGDMEQMLSSRCVDVKNPHADASTPDELFYGEEGG